MSANVETMMYVREKPWHGLGVRVEEAPNSYDAMKLAGLDWEVNPREISLLGEETAIPRLIANVRSSDNKVLGIVTDRYKIVQNVDAFAFTDTLIGGDVRYETAGSLNGGRRVWLLARMPKTTVAGDEVEPYLCFTNTHDGTGAVRAIMTPVRVVCNNTLNLALSGAKRSWSVTHSGDINKKIAEARDCLELASKYMTRLDEYAEHLIDVKVDDAALAKVLDKVFPLRENATDREKRTVQSLKDNYMVCYFAPDIAKFRGTAWGAINAMTDMAAHAEPFRKTKNFAENRWGSIINGHEKVDAMVGLLK